MLNHRFNNVLHNIAFLTSLQEPIRYCLNNVSSSDHRIFDKCAGTGATSTSPSRKLACCAHCRSHTRSPGISIMRASNLCNSSPSSAFMSSWAAQAHAFHQPVRQRLSWLHHWSIPHVHTSRAISSPEWGTDPQCKPAQVTQWNCWWQCLAAWHCISVWSLPCQFAADIGGLALSMAKSYRHGALRSTHNTCTHSHVSWKRAGGKSQPVATPWTSSRWFSHVLCFKVHSHRLLRACLPGSKTKLPPPACQVRLGTSLCGLLSKGHAVPWHCVHL